MYLEFIGKPTNEDLASYCFVPLTSPPNQIQPCLMPQFLTIALLQMEGIMDHQLEK